MADFYYEAVDSNGASVSGAIEAPSRRAAIEQLAGRNEFVTSLREGKQPGGKVCRGASTATKPGLHAGVHGRISGKDVAAMTAQLATALRAGLPLLAGLEILQQQHHKPVMKQLLGELSKAISSGQSLSEAMATRSEVFSPLYRSMIRVGETAGILDQTMTQLTALLERDQKIKTNLKNASAYPLFVLLLGIAASVLVIAVILPRIIQTISGGVDALPLPTRMLLNMGEAIRSYWWAIGGLLLITGWLFRSWLATAEGRYAWDSFKLRTPVLGNVLRAIAVGRFARTFGSLTKSGVTILESLQVVRDTLGNEVLGREIDAAGEKVRTGESLAAPLAESGRFPPLLLQIVSMGEQTGRLDELLLSAAETFDAEADAAITRFMAIFPALMIMALAVIIGFILIATLLPIVMMELGHGGF